MDIKTFTDRALCVLFPRRCRYCGTVIVPQSDVCEKCESNLPVIEPPICRFCGYSKKDCFCKNKKSFYDGIVGGFYYEGAIIKAIDRMKFHEKKFMCKVLADDMTKVIEREYADIPFDFITYVPFSKQDNKDREFNHSKELAELIGEKIEIECRGLLQQIFDKPTQHLLSSEERKGNVFGIYEVTDSEQIKGKNILLVDDIKTTGATLNECAKMLKLSGAEAVYCAVFAVTKKKKDNNVEYLK